MSQSQDDINASAVEPIILVSQDPNLLFKTLNESNGTVILDLTMEREFENPFLRVYNNTPQFVIAHPLDESNENDYRIESHEISRAKFTDIVNSSETILLKPRSETPFSKEAQQQLWENEFEN